MMRALMAIALAAAWFSTTAAQPPASFAGRWNAESPAPTAAPAQGAGQARGDMGSGWGPSIVITQDEKQLVVECLVFSRYDLQPQPKLIYALDGSETRNTVMMGRGLQVQSSRTSWQGQSLTITTVHKLADPASGKPLTIDVTQKLTLESPATLVVEATRSGVLGAKPSTTRTVYTKG